ncbi:hemoglobin/transferrin/lactoferrin receptor protein [Lacibacter cauensis]|uniref:Hemoglobin/transferrin/lactoferrin receptor protein n=1 Tax=Lacibacter cauensis TaxID=510947 RepID=A0A562SQ96_9BACT|nr:TonB-dependent receptor [Lacibacter cauensis]TWI83427.1 hemoglobin/transferrin/lactoferrin receptor protein [Lacibacter cauensis]
MRKIAIALLANVAGLWVHAQETVSDSALKELSEVVISASKFPEKKLNVAQRIDVISSKYISRVNAQNTGDLLINTGNVFVQKSQQGGSSPVIRGFEASRVLLVVDGVRLNNLIYRSGHLQNAITVDQNMLSSMEVLYGPASTIYGSDALGGVVHFRTKDPVLSTNNTTLVKGSGFARYSSANNEKTIHEDINLGWKKFAWLQSYTYSDFGDMKMGANYPSAYPTFGRRDSFVTRMNGIDTVLKNANPQVQKFSGYKQWDILQKLLFKQSDNVTHILNVQYSNTTNVPRYDRLQDKRNGTLRFAEWYYGPQERLLTAYELRIAKAGRFDNINLNLNYQEIEESRYTRDYRRYDRLDGRVENVNVAGFVLDSRKIWNNNELTIGIDGQYNTLQSTASRVNINTGASTKLDTRYPNGKNNQLNAGLFAQHVHKFKNKKLMLNDGLRVQTSRLLSTITDNSFFNLPFTKIEQKNTTVTGNVGLVYLPASGSKLSVNIASGFRAPNVDDLAKIFESSTAARQVVVPNNNIKPERTYNIDLGISQNIGKNIRIEASTFYTWFRNALVKAPYRLNGQDSILYNGVLSQVLANSNANKAYLFGVSGAVYATVANYITFSSQINFTRGRFQTDNTKNSSVYEKQANGSYALVSKKVSSKPLDHIPPVFGKTSISYQKEKLFAEIFALYNGWKKLDQYNADGEDNAQYATADGMPGWVTFNLRTSYSFKPVTLQFSIENIFDRNYRYFASGFSAPGRNFILAVRVEF